MEFVGLGTFTPNLGILPSGQRRLWDRLGPTPKDFVLYGGTALALRLGHRQSVDFDFFSRRSFRPLELARSIGYLKDPVVTQQSDSTLTCELGSGKGVVQISFFGGLSLGQIEAPDIVESNGIALAEGVACAGAIHGRQYSPALTLQALSYFDDVSDPLPEHVKATLLAAVKAVSLPDLPPIGASGKIGDDSRRS